MDTAEYGGNELELFQHASNWKAYWQTKIAPYVRGNVLEVGGGIGANTPFFAERADTLTVLEPDAKMAEQIAQLGLEKVAVEAVTTESISGQFDAIFYIDVLEHIEKDAEELAHAACLLKPNGVIVVLSPAYPSLFSPFDTHVGHFRRYTKKSLKALTLAGIQAKKVFYLDAVGCAASFANRAILSQSLPSHRQIAVWDKLMVPLSRLIDPLLVYGFGKTVIAVYEKEGES